MDSPETLHHVMIRGIERRRIVDDEQDRKDFVRRLGSLASETSTSIYAWALMSNHAHVLLSSGPQGLAKFMRRFLTGYAVGYNLRHRRHGHVFQNRYKSIVCEADSYFTDRRSVQIVEPAHAGANSPVQKFKVQRFTAITDSAWTCGCRGAMSYSLTALTAKL